jgi:cyclophilin family peptidyl-prolyl cis-trans isomerase
VGNFLDYVDSGFYDQTIFHQVLKNYVIIGGGYSSQFIEKQAGTEIRNEAGDRGARKNLRGTIAMARRPNKIDSSTCQFFINVSDNPQLDYRPPKSGVARVDDYGYCVFGKVVEGMEIVDKISGVAVGDKRVGKNEFERTPDKPVLITSVRRVH